MAQLIWPLEEISKSTRIPSSLVLSRLLNTNPDKIQVVIKIRSGNPTGLLLPAAQDKNPSLKLHSHVLSATSLFADLSIKRSLRFLDGLHYCQAAARAISL